MAELLMAFLMYFGWGREDRVTERWTAIQERSTYTDTERASALEDGTPPQPPKP